MGAKEIKRATLLAVQWFRLWASNAGGTWVWSLVGALRSHAIRCSSVNKVKLIKRNKGNGRLSFAINTVTVIFFLPETKSWSSTCRFRDIVDLMGWITLEGALEPSLRRLLSHTEGVNAIQKPFIWRWRKYLYEKGNATVHRTKIASSKRHITSWINLEIMFLCFSGKRFSYLNCS